MAKPLTPERSSNVNLVQSLSEKINQQYIPDDLLREYAQFLVSFNKLLQGNKDSSPSKKIKFLGLLLVIFLSFRVNAQCMATPTVSPCNPSGAIALVDNDIVTAGQIKTVTGTSSFNSMTVSGGTLIVCGSLTITSFAFNSGVIIINPGGSIQINVSSATVFGNNCSIYNWGNFTITGSIVTGQNNLIFNCTTTSVFTVAFNQLVIQGPNTYIVNKGLIITAFVIVQSTNSPNPICSSAPSAIVTNFMINQFANAFTSPEGVSCINITQSVINNQPMTTTSNVAICYMAGSVNFVTAPFFGSATVNSNCPNCGTLLPLKIIDFWGVCGKNVQLHWTTQNDDIVSYYEIERSVDGSNFESIAKVASKQSSARGEYNYTFDSPSSQSGYYRIKQVCTRGELEHSSLIFVNCFDKAGFSIYPSITTGGFKVTCTESIEEITIYNNSGNLVKSEWCGNQKYKNINLGEETVRGIYMVIVKTTGGTFFNQKVVLN